VINRNIEKTLDLISMQVHGYYSLGSGLYNQVGYQLGRDGIPGSGFTILASIPVIRNYRIDS
jgi:hypothetical protein